MPRERLVYACRDCAATWRASTSKRCPECRSLQIQSFGDEGEDEGEDLDVSRRSSGWMLPLLVVGGLTAVASAVVVVMLWPPPPTPAPQPAPAPQPVAAAPVTPVPEVKKGPPVDELLDARTESRILGPLTIWVKSVSWKTIALTTIEDGAPQPMLVVEIGLKNTSKDRIVDHVSWCYDLGLLNDAAAMRDSHGNRQLFIPAGLLANVAGVERSRRIRPGEQAIDIACFDRPLNNIKHLDLDLPYRGHLEGYEGKTTFRIPAGMIRWEAK